MASDAAQKFRLVLASASPRRKELLGALGLSFTVRTADVDETPQDGEDPGGYVLRVARAKASGVAVAEPDALVLAADTSVVLGGDILGKPKDAAEARAMLRRLSGRAHRVLTAVALFGRAELSIVVETQVRFRPVSEEEIAWYVGTGEPLDKAGAYAVQGAGGAFVERIDGSPSNVVGLPLAETVALLFEAGAPLPWSPL